eukprot:TRINITY_DN359_c1_g4_i1.p1 TRINITY_DN359_c1_g4~~TRINITY_DN359_c1_g4_i1.p1  ORF type:complete len:382 (+),score=134.70 TRINITY_DN359_c1_g4_i1:198-1343(+)
MQEKIRKILPNNSFCVRLNHSKETQYIRSREKMRTYSIGSDGDKLFYNYYDSDEEEITSGSRAFPVAESGNDDEPPCSGMDYLRRVREEANRMPGIVVSTRINPREFDCNQTKVLKLKRRCLPSPLHLIPLDSWKSEMLSKFEGSRKLTDEIYERNESTNNFGHFSVPKINESNKWIPLAFGHLPQNLSANSNQNSDSVPTQPKEEKNEQKGEEGEEKDNMELEKLNGKETVAENSLDDAEEGEVIEEPKPSSGSLDEEMETEEKEEKILKRVEPSFLKPSSRPLLSIFMNMQHIQIRSLTLQYMKWLQRGDMTLERAEWIYALFLRLETPFDEDVSSGMLDFLVKLCEIRASLKSHDDELAAPIAILILIITDYFKQPEH